MLILNKKATGVLATCLIAASLSIGLGSSAQSTTNVQIGILKCTVAGGVGLILGSSKGLTCTFKASDGIREYYSGNVSKFGLDIGVTKKAKISWIVIAPSGKNRSGALAGSYAGVSAEVTVAGGVGANLLVGGFNKSINLQPLSVQVQEGLNIAAGIGTMNLEYVGNRSTRNNRNFNNSYYDPYYYDGNYVTSATSGHVQWCLQRYRSYRPRTDTFRGYDGRDHRCISPYSY